MKKQMILGIMLLSAMTTGIGASASDLGHFQPNNVTDVVSPVTGIMC